MSALKVIPHFLAWTGMVLVLLRGFSGRRVLVASAGAAGFVLGIAGTAFLFSALPGETPFNVIKSLLGLCFLVLLAVSVSALYGNASLERTGWRLEDLADRPWCTASLTAAAGALMGGVWACTLSGVTGKALLPLLLLAVSGVALAWAALALEKVVPAFVTVSRSGVMAAVLAVLLFSASSHLRLDLFSPLSMKVMKFTHDFVHQFFESMLIPDHLFIRPELWGYIGFLFGKEVGFWGALILWFIPTAIVVLAVQFERLPSVAHIRQGAQRRRLLASAITARRLRLVIPGIAMLLLAAAVYRSCFPAVEYWDPKPVPVTATPAGDIFIPRKGEIDLEDGKLHKYLFTQGGKEARFFVLMTPAGKLTVDLDACAICKPDGYGQTEGTVLCYYCKTLIPLETVGKPGGCNPVPVVFVDRPDGVHIDGQTLINTWGSTIQSTAKGGGK